MRTVAPMICECDERLGAAESELRDKAKRQPGDYGIAYAQAALEVCRVRRSHLHTCKVCLSNAGEGA